MKRKLLMLLLALVVTALPTFAQNYSATFKNADLRQTIGILKKTTNHDFVYNKSLLKEKGLTVNGIYKNLPLEQLLTKTIVDQLNLSYRIDGNTIALTKGADKAFVKKKVVGNVVDRDGDPLAGATVMVKGSTNGVATDIDGNFELNVKGRNPVLAVNYVGMYPYEMRLKDYNGKLLRIELQPNDELLDEVIVTGYQTISKERATGSFSKINSGDLKNQRIASVDNILDGHIAGYSDGRLRGVTSMEGMTSPLYVIDGFPVENTRFNNNDGFGYWTENKPDINVEDIESITVLKDAAATSIYGARAANGVIVITTKKGAKGKTDVSFSANLTTQSYRTYTGYLADSQTMIELEREWESQNPNLKGEGAAKYAQALLDKNTYQTPGIQAILKSYTGQMSRDEVERKLDAWSKNGYRYYKDVDKYGKRNPLYQQYNIRIASTSDKNSFNASLSYRNNRESDKYTEDNSFGITIQNSTNLTKWLTVDVGTYINYEKGKLQTYSMMNPGFKVMPYMDLGTSENPFICRQEDKWSKSNINTINTYGLNNLDINPRDEIGMNLKRNRVFGARTYARLNFSISDYLKILVQYQYESKDDQSTQLKDKNSYDVRYKINTFASAGEYGETVFNMPNGNIYTRDNNEKRAYNLRTQLDFNKTFAGKHDVSVLAGMELRENKNRFNGSTLYDYDPELLTFSFLDAANLSAFMGGLMGWGYIMESDIAWIKENTNRFMSFYGNAAYTYDTKYMLTGSIRWDRTNLFATGSKYQNKPIWSVGAAWRIDRENFMHLNWINMLKLRGSYGIGGNIAKNTTPYMTAIYDMNYNFFIPQAQINSRPNPNLRWEKTTTINLGVEFSILNNRLSGTLEYYNKKGSDLLANVNGRPVEGFGYDTYTINNGKMTNNGFEITLNGIGYSDRNWTWSINGTFGYNKNKVTYVNVKAPVATMFYSYPQAYPRIGLPYWSLYRYQWAGLNEDGLPTLLDHEGNIVEKRQPQNVDDFVYAGTSVPVYNGSVGTNLRWRNFELSALMIFEGGHKMANSNTPYLYGMQPVSVDIKKRWKKPGDEKVTDVPRYVSQENPLYNGNYQTMLMRSTANILDATNWKLRNLSLSYSLPQSLISKLYMKNARVMIGMENVFTIAKCKQAKYQLGGFERPLYTFGIYVNF